MYFFYDYLFAKVNYFFEKRKKNGGWIKKNMYACDAGKREGYIYMLAIQYAERTA